MNIECLLGTILAQAGGIMITLIVLGYLLYWLYNLWLVRILDWKNDLSRREFFEIIKEYRKRRMKK